MTAEKDSNDGRAKNIVHSVQRRALPTLVLSFIIAAHRFSNVWNTAIVATEIHYFSGIFIAKQLKTVNFTTQRQDYYDSD